MALTYLRNTRQTLQLTVNGAQMEEEDKGHCYFVTL